MWESLQPLPLSIYALFDNARQNLVNSESEISAVNLRNKKLVVIPISGDSQPFQEQKEVCFSSLSPELVCRKILIGIDWTERMLTSITDG